MNVLVPELIWTEEGLSSDCALWLQGDRIHHLGPAAEAPPDALRLPGKALLPGLVNAHSHAFQRGLRGHVQYATGADSFWSWRERMYGLANRLNPAEIAAVSALAFLEMLKTGFTSVGEFHYLQHQPDGTPYENPDELALSVVNAAESLGLRIVLLRVAYARAGFGLPVNPLQRRFIDPNPEAVLLATERLRARGVAVGLAPHSIRAVTESWLQAFSSFSGPIHAHVDEQPAEITACLQEHRRRPLQVFADAGLVDSRFTAVHFTHGDPKEIAEMGEARVCVCPSTEMDLGDGLLPAEHLQHVPLCIGSDSHALIDPFYEMRALEWHARVRTGHRNVLEPHDQPDTSSLRLWRAGSREGARALGLEAGFFGPGALADLVAIDLNRLEFAGARPMPALVFNGSPAAVRDVWVGGRRVVEDGHHPQEERIVGAALKVLAA